VFGETNLECAVLEGFLHICLDVVQGILARWRSLTVIGAMFVEVYVVVAH
jgi:hypothetical protein